MSANFDAYVDANWDRLVRQLQNYCRNPCITGHGVGVRETAEATAQLLQDLGAETRLIETDGAPIVYGEVGVGPRTLLIYNHYDVQPPEPLDLWASDPFAAEVRDGKVFARGVADNRGDVMARIQAVEAYRAAVGELPIKVKFLIEGEEEIGSPSLAAFVERHRDPLQADGCLWETGSLDEQDRFVIALGLKGVVHLELRATAAKVDLHSSLATIVPNAAWRLTWALASLKTPDDRITVDGLMDHVFEPSAADMEELRQIPFDEERMKDELGIRTFNRGLTGLDLLKKHLYEPTCTIQGQLGGYTGPGLKAVSPHEAMAKVEFRLVPHLEPDLVLRLLREHLDRRGFEDVEIVVFAKLNPARAPRDAAIVRAAVDAAREVYQAPPVIYPLMAGSGPMSYFSAGLGVPVVSAGGLIWRDSRIHAPNESIRLADYAAGIRYIGRLIDRFAVA